MLLRHRHALLTLLAIYALIFTFSWLMPKVSDDFAFQANMQSYAHVIDLAIDKYINWDGRFTLFLVNHTILYLPHMLGSALIAFFFCTLTLLIHIHIHGHTWSEHFQAGRILWTAALLWAIVPAFGAVFFWKTGVVYCYASILLLAFLLPYRFSFSIPAHTPPSSLSHGKALLFFVFSLYVGLHDYSIPLVFAAFSLCIYLYNKCILHAPAAYNRVFAAGGLGLLLGNLIVLTAPGNLVRVQANPAYVAFANLSLLEKIAKYTVKLDIIHSLFIIPYLLIAWALCVLIKTYSKNTWRFLPFWGCVFLLFAQAAIASFVLSPTSPARAFTAASIFLIISGYIFVLTAQPLAGRVAQRVLRMGQCLVLTFCALSIPYEMSVFLQADKTTQTRHALLTQSQNSICIPSYNLAMDRFLPIGNGERGEIHDVSEDPNLWLNKDIARAYGLEAVRRCPALPRFFTPEDTDAPLKAQLVDETMYVRLTTNDSPPTILQIFLPSNIHNYMNPNPLLDALQKNILGNPYVRDALIPLLYKSISITLRPHSQDTGEIEGEATWEHIVPNAMHFYVRLPQQPQALMRLDAPPLPENN